MTTTYLDSAVLGGAGPTKAPHTVPAASRYNRTAMMFHWGLGMAIVAVLGVGLYMAGQPFSPLRLKLFNWHKWAGISLLALSVLRLVWRLTHRPSALPERIAKSMPPWQRGAHKATPFGLYSLFFAVPLIGCAYGSAA